MIKIAISQAAYEAITATMPLGSVGYENATNENGERLIWLPHDVLNRLNHLRRPATATAMSFCGWLRRSDRRARPAQAGVTMRGPARLKSYLQATAGLHDISVLSKSCYGPSLSGNKAVIGGMSPNGST
jgi:hypothetical protein